MLKQIPVFLSAALVAEWQRVGAQTLAQQQAACASLETAAAQITDRAGRHVSDTLEGATRLVSQSEALVQSRMASESQWLAAQAERMDQLAGVWRAELQALRDAEALRAQAAVDRLEQLQVAVAQHLATLGASLEAPISRLLQTAAEVPQAASEVITQLRREMAQMRRKGGRR